MVLYGSYIPSDIAMIVVMFVAMAIVVGVGTFVVKKAAEGRRSTGTD